MKVEITISTPHLFDIHKVTVSPSVAVNPPAIQYFRGIDHDYVNGNFSNIDRRLPQIKDFILTMLSSEDYPNEPICNRYIAEKIADKLLPKMLKKIGSKPVTIKETYVLKGG